MSQVLTQTLPYQAVRTNRRQSLATMLTSAGIPVLSKKAARTHKRKVLQDAAGINPPMYWTLRTLLHALRVLSLFPLVELFVESLSQRRDALSAYKIVIAMSSISGIVASFFNLSLGLVVLAPTLSLLSVFLIGFGLDRFSSYQLQVALLSRWARTSARFFMPERIERRMLAAQDLPGVRTEIEYFDKDPFLLAVRGWGPFREIEYIGAWETGNQSLDSV